MIGGENSRKPVFGFRLLEEKKFCKGLRINKNLPIRKAGDRHLIYQIDNYDELFTPAPALRSKAVQLCELSAINDIVD